MSVGVFCNVSYHEAAYLPNTMAPLLRHPDVEAIAVVHTGNGKPDNFGSLSRDFDKVTEYHRTFGEGYDRSVEDGGYDQYAARLFAVEEIEQAKTDWIIQFDADEFLTTEAIAVIESAADMHDVVALDYYTLLSETEYWFEERRLRRIGREDLMDPHLLIWRRRLEKRPELCDQSRCIYANKTRHCSVSFPNFPYWRTLTAKGLYHFHFHCLLSKENASKRTHAHPFNRPLPKEVIECIEGLSDFMLPSSRINYD